MDIVRRGREHYLWGHEVSEVGDILAGKYRLERLLGRGGMGSVFVARHVRIGRQVAVKVLLPALAGSATALARLTDEARAAATIGHPGIVDVFDLETAEDGTPFLVMELLEGRSLAEELEAEGRLPPARAATVCCEVLSALAAAHERGILHRDIKPQNVFLARTRRGEPAAKLLDFGVARIADFEDARRRLTLTGLTVGTPAYMAPEQARGERDLDPRVDLWAVGVVLYRCLTGQRPFVGDVAGSVMAAILQDEPAPPKELRPDLDAGLDAVVMRALRKPRDERYPDAHAMLAALLPFADEGARDRITQPPPSPSAASKLADDPTLPGVGERPSAGPTALEVPAAPRPEAGAREPLPPTLVQSSPLEQAGQPAPAAAPPPTVPAAVPSQPGRRRWWIVGGIFGLAVVGAAVAILLVATFRRDEPGEGPVVTEPSGPPLVVQLRVLVEAPNAWVRIDDGPPHEAPYVALVPRDDRPHTVAAMAEGFREKRVSVVFDQRQTVTIALHRAGDAGPDGAASAAVAAPDASARPAPRRPAKSRSATPSGRGEYRPPVFEEPRRRPAAKQREVLSPWPGDGPAKPPRSQERTIEPDNPYRPPFFD